MEELGTPQEQFLEFERKLLSNPNTFFGTFEAGYAGRKRIILKKYEAWQCANPIRPELTVTLKERFPSEFTDSVFIRGIGDRVLCQAYDNTQVDTKLLPPVLQSVYSFALDRPQYLKFIDGRGLYNPLEMLKRHFLPHRR